MCLLNFGARTAPGVTLHSHSLVSMNWGWELSLLSLLKWVRTGAGTLLNAGFRLSLLFRLRA